ncbi:hypothetical protein OAP89_00815 [Candidatus Pelagibacter sp.]|nr:hypothetical protein [Candidatus Pelagibacter sp.]
MNIYLHCEVYSREFDSKLLLAILAASRGHEVIISDIEVIEKGISRGMLAPGVFHTKSLTPAESKITRHSNFIKAGFKITSIDEEGGLVTEGYDDFAKLRFSNQTIEMASAIFTWGKEDTDSLKKNFPSYSSKIYMTGSPRVDLWKPIFSSSLNPPSNFTKRPYLLIVSNLANCNGVVPFYKQIQQLINTDYHKRDPNIIKVLFETASDEYRLILAFVEAIKYLAKNNTEFDIILRPHPNEDINSWKIYLEGLPNVYVIKEGAINSWVKNSFAVMHNGCTTAYEATISDKPLITYVPFVMQHGNDLPNELGYIINTKEDLSNKVNDLFSGTKLEKKKNSNHYNNEKIFNKLYLDNNELSAEKILKIWEEVDDKTLSKFNNWILFELRLKIMKINGIIGNLYKKIFNNSFNKKENYKFPPLDKKKIIYQVKKFERILGIKQKIYCKLLSDRTVLIKREKL